MMDAVEVGCLMVVGFMCGLITGSFIQWLNHRNYCDCKMCSAWRIQQAKKSERRKPE